MKTAHVDTVVLIRIFYMAAFALEGLNSNLIVDKSQPGAANDCHGLVASSQMTTHATTSIAAVSALGTEEAEQARPLDMR